MVLKEIFLISGRSNLKKHEREKHGIDNAKFIRKDRQVKIECSKCSEQFESPLELNEHIGKSRFYVKILFKFSGPVERFLNHRDYG